MMTLNNVLVPTDFREARGERLTRTFGVPLSFHSQLEALCPSRYWTA
jgi:hypothetical protein